jgi:hypothetical protein
MPRDPFKGHRFRREIILLGPVPFLLRTECSFKPPFVRGRQGFSGPKLRRCKITPHNGYGLTTMTTPIWGSAA